MLSNQPTNFFPLYVPVITIIINLHYNARLPDSETAQENMVNYSGAGHVSKEFLSSLFSFSSSPFHYRLTWWDHGHVPREFFFLFLVLTTDWHDVIKPPPSLPAPPTPPPLLHPPPPRKLRYFPLKTDLGTTLMPSLHKHITKQHNMYIY